MIRKSLISSSLIVFSLGNSFAIAQTADNAAEIITRCAAEQDTGERIACLEAALQRETRPTDVERAAGSATKADTNEQPNTDSAALPENSPSVKEVATLPELGAEQVAARTPTPRETSSPEPERQQFAVASTRTVPYEKLELSLVNGQVWRQIKGDNQKIRIPRKHRENLTVEIWRAPVSGYKLRLTELRRTIRVERLK